MGIKLKNNAFSTLAASLASNATSMTVASGHGARFPILGAGDYFYATLVDTGGNYEVVKVIARTDDTMTIVRAQEGTLAIPFVANSRVELRITAQTIADIMDGVMVVESYTHGNLL
jgi:hypothetical protein